MGPKGNVVPLGSHPRAKSRLTPQESASVLKGCRELALDRMGDALSGMLDRVEDDLFELADKAPERDAQNLYLDARTQARAHRTAIESSFRQHFVECFNLKVLGDAPPPAEPETELALVDEEELERRLAMNEMSRQLGSTCEKELFALSQRMGFLLERPELEDDANPLSPATICAALKDAVDQIQSDYKVRMALLRELTRLAEGELDRVYHDLNALLVERRILPDVRPTVRGSPSGVPRRPNATEAADGHAPTADLFSTLAQLVAPAGGAPAGGGAPAAPVAFVNELTRLHREVLVPRAGAAPVNVLRDLKMVPREGELSHVDAATIDIVAMLFDYAFEDADIPASVKALLARLQIPVLKVALLDRGFFSTDTHPARRLIDLLAQVGIGLDEHDERGRAALALIGNVVEAVVRDFETEVAFFAALVARVEAFVAEQDRAEAELVERSARLVETRERDEIARLVAEEEVGRRLRARMWAPTPVRDMLLGTWVRALAAVQQAEGEGSPAWQALVHTMDDLLWSVEPKSTPDERKRLVGMLPAMLRRMHEGFERGKMPAAEREAFFGSLVDCHATAVKAGMRGLAVLPDASGAPRAEGFSLERAVVPAGDIQVEEIRLRGPRGGAVLNVFTRTGIWTNLARGTWVELADGKGGAWRARLTWISPNKGVYLFTNPASGRRALSISPEALAEKMRLGEARVIDATPLVGRAVGSMLEGLRGQG
ncbi:MAG TPA: DUF1631 domain-containing protein [Usitatibacter sp.]|nr:DUF1631 domain-containing protein [Usitatibacter sp.]